MKLSKLKAQTGMRKLAGTEVPRINSTSKAFAAAKAKADETGYAGEGSQIDGDMASARLDRPARRHGGKVMRADGGEVKKSDNPDGNPPDPITASIEAGRALGRMGRAAKLMFMKDGFDRQRGIRELEEDQDDARRRTGSVALGPIKAKPETYPKDDRNARKSGGRVKGKC